MFIVSVIVQSNCDISQFSHQMFNVSALLPDDALKLATPMTNDGAINQTLRQTPSMKEPPNSIIDGIQVRAVWKPSHMLDSINVDHAIGHCRRRLDCDV